MDYSEIFIFNDQPTTCPKCGNRTEITLELTNTVEKAQYHKCLSSDCSFNFVVEEDTEIQGLR